ncbi:MAG: hypothetical protein AB8F94_00385 [Saprospiraceae bacterium]
MNLKIKSTVFVVILAFLLLLCILFPNPNLIMGITILGSVLIGYQTFSILKEDPKQGSKGNYKLP